MCGLTVTLLLVAALASTGCPWDEEPISSGGAATTDPCAADPVACEIERGRQRLQAIAARLQQPSMTVSEMIALQQQATTASATASTGLVQQANQNASPEQWAQWYADRTRHANQMIELERQFAERKVADDQAYEQRRVEMQRLEEQRRQQTLEEQARLRRAAEQARRDEAYFGDQQAIDERRAREKEAIWAGAYD